MRCYGDVPPLNALVEVIGIVGGAPGGATVGAEAADAPTPGYGDLFEAQMAADEAAWDPPVSRVARLHAVRWRKRPAARTSPTNRGDVAGATWLF